MAAAGRRAGRETAAAKTDERKLPVKADPEPVASTTRRSADFESRRGNHIEGYVMNCQNHPEIPATAYCRSCGKPLCDQCRRMLTEPFIARSMRPLPRPGPGPMRRPSRPARRASRGAMRVLRRLARAGLFPGLDPRGRRHLQRPVCQRPGARGYLRHAGEHHRFAARSRGLEPLFGMLLAVWMFYMAFEAYHTARKRRNGEPVDEYSSLINLRGRNDQVPVAGIALIAARHSDAAAHAEPARFRICGPLLAGAADCGGCVPAL